MLQLCIVGTLQNNNANNANNNQKHGKAKNGMQLDGEVRRKLFVQFTCDFGHKSDSTFKYEPYIERHLFVGALLRISN